MVETPGIEPGAFHKQSEMSRFQKSVVGGADGDDLDKPVVG